MTVLILSNCIFHFEQTSFLIIRSHTQVMVLTVQMVNKIRENLEKNTITVSAKSKKH